MAVTEDHSIWVFGMISGKEKLQEDYDVVRRYSRDGVLPGSCVSRSTFPPDRKSRMPFEPTELMASGKEVVLVAEGQLIDLDADGRVPGHMRLDNLPMQYFRRFAFTSDRRIYGCGDKGDSLVLFDVQAGTWKETAFPAPYGLGLLGTDETTLVFRKDQRGKNDPMVTLQGFQPPKINSYAPDFCLGSRKKCRTMLSAVRLTFFAGIICRGDVASWGEPDCGTRTAIAYPSRPDEIRFTSPLSQRCRCLRASRQHWFIIPRSDWSAAGYSALDLVET